ncbi:islet cell autoantigen 1-like [Stegodyphus dumicola]|uniref:islet cell autoantigen 1-like n=1 Tax=Stegodyphus dumicola TaxID=202533 RepID=UPI0015B28DBB|nr:islet cell autoantigen 1-like [Stegodyphus dumicola]
MNPKQLEKSSAVTKMQQAYWEARQAVGKSFGEQIDGCVISSDSNLDSKIQLLQAADNSFNSLMGVLVRYGNALQTLMDQEDNLGLALVKYGLEDKTSAGHLLSDCGKIFSRNAHQKAPLRTALIKIHHEVQIFQFKATVDVLQTVAKMEKFRKSYRSGLMWMKNESEGLDPDMKRKMKNFRRVQAHIKKLKVQFDGKKLECMQKIDLFLLSRCNLFSQTLLPYRKLFCKISKHVASLTDAVIQDIPFYLSYKFETLKELNLYSKMSHASLQSQLLNQKHKKLSKAVSKMKRSGCKSKVNYNSSEKSGLSIIESNSQEKLSICNKCPVTSNLKEDGNRNSAFSVQQATILAQHQDTNKCSDNLLINLDDETSSHSFLNLSARESEKKTGKYSDDLQSIIIGDSYFSHNNLKKNTLDLEHEFKNCEELINSAFKEEQNDSSKLKFWPLMESVRTSGGESSEISAERQTVPGKNIQTDCLNSSCSKWTDILIQFDPFNTVKLDTNVVQEEC